jgi:D-inositol-3-phosphate glycosyltransferase
MNVYVRDLTRQLGRIGVHVDVFTRSQNEHVPHVLHDLGYGNRVVHIPAGPEVPLPKKELASYVTDFVAKIAEFTEQKGIQYDLIHSHYWMSGIAARELKARWNIPVIHMFHTLGHMKNRVAGFGEAEGDYRIRGEEEVIRSVDRVVAATPAELAQLQWLYKADTQKVVVVPPGVDTSHFYPIDQDEAKEYTHVPLHHLNVLFVGRIEPLKGIDILIKALGLVNQQDNSLIHPKHFCVAIIGGDPDVSREDMTREMTRLQNLRESVGVGDMVTFLGKKSQDSLPYYYSATDVLVMPSHYESFGLVALEAMACGTPVIASQVGGLAFLVKDGVTGFHVPGDDPEALSQRLLEILTDEKLRSKMGQQAAEYAKQYDWALIAEKLLVVYEDMLANSIPIPKSENHR